jgi:hypothetical protein
MVCDSPRLLDPNSGKERLKSIQNFSQSPVGIQDTNFLPAHLSTHQILRVRRAKETPFSTPKEPRKVQCMGSATDALSLPDP